jgi:hypothetical protein
MEVFPKLQVSRFEQLKPGDLFLSLEGTERYYAFKTAKRAQDDKNNMVLLGPHFVHGTAESFLVPWEPMTVLSLGTAFTILLSNDPKSWSSKGPDRTPVCLAIADGKTYICTNGAESPNRHFPCFVDTENGEIVEKHLPGISAYTGSWEITLSRPGNVTRTLIKYPLKSKSAPNLTTRS